MSVGGGCQVWRLCVACRVDGVVSRYFCCLRRGEVKVNSVGRVTPSLDFVAYRRICDLCILLYLKF